MKKLFVLYILVLTLSLILTGCDNGSASDSTSANLVKVSLTVGDNASNVAQKIVTVDSGISNNLTYEYMAEALWISSNIHGETSWTRISYSNADTNLGYFTSGQWKFSVRILDGSNVIYKGDTTTYIAPGSTNVTVLVSKQFEDAAAGQVHISVTAPTLAGENLGISYTLGNVTTNLGNASATSANGITTFEYTAQNLAAGEYTFFLNYLSGSSGAAVAVDLRPGEEAQITGHLDNGIWQVGYLYLKLHTITINASCNVNTNVSSAAIGDRVSFSLEPLEGTILTEDGIRVTYGNNQTIIPEESIGGLYTFTMPDADVTINAIYEGISQNINIAYLKAAVKMLYNYNPTAEKFGRVADPLANPSLKHYGVKNVTLWYDTSEKKICWYSGSDIVKFQPGSMANFFKDFATLKDIDLKGFDTSDVTSMAHIFDGCLKLQSVDLTGCDTSSVKDMSYMFSKAGYNNIGNKTNNKWQHVTHTNPLVITGLNTINSETEKPYFNTENVENMSHMFYTCSMDSVNVATFDVSKVRDFSYMFSGECDSGWTHFCYNKFTSLAVSGWKVGKNVPASENGQPVYINMGHMFDMCNELEGLSLTSDASNEAAGWDFSKVNNMASMFNRCEAATYIVFPKHTVLTNVTTMLSVFCRNRYFPMGSGNGDGGFTDIFSRWDLRANNIIDFKASIAGNNGDSPNRLIQNDTEAFKTQRTFTTYGGLQFKIGGNDLASVTDQRLAKVVTQ